MAADIVFDQSQGDSITLDADRVRVTGRINLQHVQGAEPPADGQFGDLVVTVEESSSLVGDFTTTRLWLCVRPDGLTRSEPGQTFWREVQLGSAIVVNR